MKDPITQPSYIITSALVVAFGHHLAHEEKCPGTVEKYLRDVRALAHYLHGQPVTKEQAVAWRDGLLAHGYAPATINSMTAAINQFFCFTGWTDCRIKALRIQRRLFRQPQREMTKDDYLRLVSCARANGQERLALVMETICATGIRVSEIKYITLEAVQAGQAEICLQGKLRTILLPSKLCRKLKQYAKKQKTAFGEIFLTKSGKSLSRRQIWAEMKRLCRQADVIASKVFPHNLRHLFARTFYHICRDIVKLADVLGHASIETTRIYLISTGAEHAKVLQKLGFVQ